MDGTITNEFVNAARRQAGSALNIERLAFVSGIAFSFIQFGVMLYFMILVLPQMGPPDAAAQHVAFYTQHGATLRLGNYLMTLPTPFFLFFLAGLGGVLRRAEGGGSTLATATVTSGAIVAILWPLSAVLNNIGIDIAQAGGDAATIVALDAIGPYMLALSTLPRAILLAAASVGLLNGRFIPRWLGWLGLALAVVSLVGSGTMLVGQLFPVLALGTILFEVWILLLSNALRRGCLPG
jgi:hypothetical protein